MPLLVMAAAQLDAQLLGLVFQSRPDIMAGIQEAAGMPTAFSPLRPTAPAADPVPAPHVDAMRCGLGRETWSPKPNPLTCAPTVPCWD